MDLISLYAGAYLLGAFPTSYLVGKFCGINLFEKGSGNVGATNALRVLGARAGFFVLSIDVAKGWAPVFLCLHFFPNLILEPYIVGIITVLGHSFSVFLRFRGGKGVATSAGVFLALAPQAIILALGIFSLTVISTRLVSLGSILSALALPFLTWQLYPEPPLTWQVSTLLAVLILVRHRPNMARLLKGQELRIEWKK
jgi:acyl phosphate:glycerol-3-phosphate acyltransferase